MMSRNVLIVEDDYATRRQLIDCLGCEADLEVIGVVGNGTAALHAVESSKPDIVLLDVSIPELDGLAFMHNAKLLHKRIAILVVSACEDDEHIVSALAGGADGYLLKSRISGNLPRLIRETLAGQFVLSGTIAANLARYAVQYGPVAKKQSVSKLLGNSNQFSARDREIALMLSSRLSNLEMAARLGVKVGTVKNYLTALYEKLCVVNRNTQHRLGYEL